jgi:hypothetical protein
MRTLTTAEVETQTNEEELLIFIEHSRQYILPSFICFCKFRYGSTSSPDSYRVMMYFQKMGGPFAQPEKTIKYGQ